MRAGEIALPAPPVPEPFIDVDDIAEVVATVLNDDRHGDRIHDVTGPRALAFGEAVAEMVQGTFLELIRNVRVVQAVRFESGDAAFEGEMKMAWNLSPVAGGTEVSIACSDVPLGIRKEDHDVGLRSTLENLAKFVE